MSGLLFGVLAPLLVAIASLVLSVGANLLTPLVEEWHASRVRSPRERLEALRRRDEELLSWYQDHREAAEFEIGMIRARSSSAMTATVLGTIIFATAIIILMNGENVGDPLILTVGYLSLLLTGLALSVHIALVHRAEKLAAIVRASFER